MNSLSAAGQAQKGAKRQDLYISSQGGRFDIAPYEQFISDWPSPGPYLGLRLPLGAGLDMGAAFGCCLQHGCCVGLGLGSALLALCLCGKQCGTFVSRPKIDRASETVNWVINYCSKLDGDMAGRPLEMPSGPFQHAEVTFDAFLTPQRKWQFKKRKKCMSLAGTLPRAPFL